MNPPNVSTNFYRNLYHIAVSTGVGISHIENKGGMRSGYCSMGLRRNSSPTLRVAKNLADAVGYTIEELCMDPKDFRAYTRQDHDN